MTPSDWDLLQAYVEQHSEDAFETLVGRYLNLVYSAALRQIQSAPLAEEIAQSVFLDLSRQASKLKPDTILSAWLYRVTRLTAIEVLRQEVSRQRRELKAMDPTTTLSGPSEWAALEPLLEEAMDALGEKDRNAVLLRYFENRSLAEVGKALGVSEDAAQKRVARAVDRLKDFFTRRKIAIGSASLAALISSNAVQAAPPALLNTLPGVASTLASGLVAPASSGFAKAIAMTTTKKLAVAALITAAVGTGVYQQVQLVELKRQYTAANAVINRLSAKPSPVPDQTMTDSQPGMSPEDRTELLRLRAEVARSREDARELAKLKSTNADVKANSEAARLMESLATRVGNLKQKLAQMPEQKIPEMKFLQDRDWLEVASEMDASTDEELRKGLAHLRTLAKNKAGKLILQALQAYAKASGGQLPSAMGDLTPYFKSPVEGEILQRYQVVQSGNGKDLKPGFPVIEERFLLDKENDGFMRIGLDGYGFNLPNGHLNLQRKLAVAYGSDSDEVEEGTPTNFKH